MIEKSKVRTKDWFKNSLTTGIFGFVCDKEFLVRLELTPERVMETEMLIPFVVVNDTCVLANGSCVLIEEAVEDLSRIESCFFNGDFYLNNVITNKYVITHIISVPENADLQSFHYARTYLRDYYRYPKDEYYHNIISYVNPALKKPVTLQELREELGFNFFIREN